MGLLYELLLVYIMVHFPPVVSLRRLKAKKFLLFSSPLLEVAITSDVHWPCNHYLLTRDFFFFSSDTHLVMYSLLFVELTCIHYICE